MKLRYLDPFHSGYLMRYAPVGVGGFAWPANRMRCEGYTARGIAAPCGVVFETRAGNTETRCEACRKAHKREWFRLRSQRRRKATA